MNCIILMGIKHCGKSTQGKILGRKLNMPFYDTDNVIIEQTGRTAREIYVEGGEQAFKEAEAEACRMIAGKLTAGKQDAVIATGGGICANAQALAFLRTLGRFVFLQADERTAADRIVREAVIDDDGNLSNIPAYIAKKNPHTRQDVRTAFHDFYVERTEKYLSLADVTVLMENKPKQENTQCILASLGLEAKD